MNPTELFLVLTYHWYDETVSGRKRIEYREMKTHWTRLIWNRRETLTHVTFSRGYTDTRTRYEITKIDVGPCPIPGWSGDYYRIYFKEVE